MKHIKSSIEVLSPSEIQLLHDSSAKILETIGIHVPCAEVLKRCAALGAVIDLETETMHIPQHVLECVLDKIKELNADTFAVESQRRDIYAHISTQVFCTDYKTRTSRYGLRDDNLKGFALLEHLENFPYACPVVVPSDVPDQLSDLISFQDIYKYSTKPGATYILTPTSAKYIVEINKLMNRPTWYLLETISPLSYKKDTLEMALFAAENGGIIGTGPMVMSGATGPVTLAGSMALENAEILASIFIIYALTGKSSDYCASMHSMDMKSMLCSFGSANQALFGAAMAQMAAFYGMTSMTNAGLTDALLPDFQGGIEKGITACFNYLAGGRRMGAQGIVGADQGISFEQMVLDNEWVKYYNYITSGIEVTEETIGLDAIAEVGIKGNFLDCDHTFDYWRESYLQSDIFLRDNIVNWTNQSQPELLDRAHAFVEEKTKDYKNRQPVISQSLCDEIDRIVQDATAEIMKNK